MIAAIQDRANRGPSAACLATLKIAADSTNYTLPPLTRIKVFGPELPAQGMAYGSLNHMLQSLRRYGLVQGDGEDAINGLIHDGFVIIESKNPREIQVFAKKLPLKLTPDVADKVKEFLRISERGLRSPSLDTAYALARAGLSVMVHPRPLPQMVPQAPTMLAATMPQRSTTGH